MRKLFLVLLVFTLTGCNAIESVNSKNYNEQSEIHIEVNNGGTANKNVEIKADTVTPDLKVNSLKSDVVVKLFDIKKDELIKALGDNYKIVESGPDGSYDGYYYEKYGLNAVFVLTDFVDYFECAKIDNVSIGMAFSDVMNVFGKTKINEINIPAEDGIPGVHEYELNYDIDGHLLRFISTENNIVSEIIFYNEEYSNYFFSNK